MLRARLFALLLGSTLVQPMVSGAADGPTVAYLGSREAYLYRQLRVSQFPEVSLAEGPAVVVIAGGGLTASDVPIVRSLVERGAGLVLIFGPDLDDSTLSRLLGAPILRQATDSVTVLSGPGQDPLVRAIPWRSAPQVGQRTMAEGLPSTVLLRSSSGDPLVQRFPLGRGTVFLVAPWFATSSPEAPETADYQFQTWSYFPYLLYGLVTEAAGSEPVSFALWPAAPLPNYTERLTLAVLFAGLLGLTATLFLAVRRYSARHPEILDDFVRANFGHRELASEHPSGWDEIGYHRPLGGFLMFFVLALFIGLPLLLGYSILFRNIVFPFPHAAGIWQWVKQFFQFLFTFLDLGTSVALVKYFAELRIHDPRRGLEYVQFYVWWQALSGVAQLALVAAAAIFALPGTDYAALCYVVLGHALIQLPGFLLLFHHVFSAFQRFDLAQILTLLVPIVPLPLALVAVRLLRAWGLENPRFGEALGSIFGMAVSDYIGVLSLFVLGLLLFRSVYGSSRVLFLAHFDWSVARTSLGFGFRAALSGVAVGLSAMAQTVILAETVDNYAELQGIWGFGWETILIYIAVAVLLFDNIRAGVAEAYNNGKDQLTLYYLTASLRWGFLLGFILWGLLSVYWPWLIAGVYGDQWVRTADYIWLFQLMGLMHILAMLPTPFLQACGRPGLDATTVWVEHSVLILLLYYLTPEYQLWGMLYARAGSLLFARIIPVWWLLWRFVARPPLYPWQTFLAPLATGVTIMALYRLVGAFVWNGGVASTLALVFGGIFIGTPLAFFLSGLFGGWDDRNLAEAQKAIALTRFARPLVAALQKAAIVGCRWSPLHNRFPIDLAEPAAREAAALMRERHATARRLSHETS